nr:hypothetical protein [Escherichia coli]
MVIRFTGKEFWQKRLLYKSSWRKLNCNI